MGDNLSTLFQEDSEAVQPFRLSSDGPDTIFVSKGGTILTMEDSHPTAEALAVTGDKITAVGGAEDVLKMKGAGTKVVELTGTQTLMPGLIEPHTHPSLLSDLQYSCSLSGFKYSSFSEIYKVMKETVKDVSQRAKSTLPWIRFTGWNMVLVRDLPVLDAKWLDENLTSEYPVFVHQAMCHCCWVNHKALEICGITEDTPDPLGGKIEKDGDGNPTGLMKETPAIQLITAHFPKPGPATIVSTTFDVLEQYSKCGVTTLAEMGLMPLDIIKTFGLSLLTLVPTFPVRLGIYYTPASPIQPNSVNHIGKKLWFPGVKVWADGSPYIGTMACNDPYPKTEFTEKLNFDFNGCPNGLLNYSEDKLYELLRNHSNGLLAIHAHGERAIDQALNVYEKIMKDRPQVDDCRYRLEHCGLITEDQMRRAAKLGVTVTFYIDHVYYYGEALCEIIGERAKRFAPAGRATACGLNHWTIHQDTPCSPLDPFLAMKNAVLRKTRQEGKTLGPEYCTTIDDALKAYTINAAWQLKREGEIGSLVVGKLADLVLLSQNPRETKPEDLTSIKVEATYLGGHCFKY